MPKKLVVVDKYTSVMMQQFDEDLYWASGACNWFSLSENESLETMQESVCCVGWLVWDQPCMAIIGDQLDMFAGSWRQWHRVMDGETGWPISWNKISHWLTVFLVIIKQIILALFVNVCDRSWPNHFLFNILTFVHNYYQSDILRILSYFGAWSQSHFPRSKR